MTAGLTLEIVDRVGAWLLARPNASPRASALAAAVVNEGLSCLDERARSVEYSHAQAFAHEAAALGCLLALVSEAWGDPDLYVASGWNVYCKQWWHVSSILRIGGDMPPCGRGSNKAEALLAALESAP